MSPPAAGPARERVEALFLEALDLDATGRRRLLEAAGREDPGLPDEVASLLAAHDRPGPLADLPEEERPLGGRFPERLGPYRIVRLLGEGGMGVVLLAIREAEDFEQTVALKLVRGRFVDPLLARRFQEERRILARLEHPGIARLIDGGVLDDGQPYYAMEFVHGEDLLAWADRRSLGVRERVELFVRVCEAVHAAHGQLVVHRDLKPSNILVTPHGQPKLLDFGIAKSLEGEAEGKTQLWVTPAYASPEQLAGDRVTAATDVYALGVLLCELLSGFRPYRTADLPAARLSRVVAETPARPPSELAERGLPRAGSDEGLERATVDASAAARRQSPAQLGRVLRGDLDTIVLTAVAKEPGRRYDSARRLAEDLRRWLDGRPIEARRATPGYRMRKFLGRNRAASLAAALFVVALVGGMGATLWQAREARAARDVAQAQAARAGQVTALVTELFRLGDPTRAPEDTLGIRQVLADGVARVEATLADDPELQATLFLELAQIHRNLGMLDEAGGLADRAVALRARVDPDGPGHADALGRRALLSAELGDPRSVPLLEAALARTREVPVSDTLVAELLTELGWAVRDDREYERAAALFQEALDLDRGGAGVGRGTTARAMLGLASTFHDQGAFQEAEALFLQALEGEGSGRPDPVAAAAMANLGMIHRLREQYVQAVPMVRGGREMRSALFEPQHPDRIESDEEWGVTLVALGRFGEAEPVLRDALERSARELGEAHAHTRGTRESLALADWALGRYDLAVARIDSVIGAKRVARGADHPGVVFSLVLQGQVLLEAGRVDEARRRFREAEAIRGRLEGEPGTYTVLIRAGLGRAALEEGRLAEADSLLEAAAELAGTVLRPDHRYALDVERERARLRLARGEPAEALRILDRVAEAEGRIRPYPHPRRGETELLRSGALEALGDAAGARGARDEAARNVVELPADHPLRRAVEGRGGSA